MDDLSLLLTSIFLIIALFLSKSFKAGVEKDMIVATVRAVIQLLIIGYVLSLIFRGDHPIFIILMVLSCSRPLHTMSPNGKKCGSAHFGAFF